MKPGPRIGKYGKKKASAFCLSALVLIELEKLAMKEGLSRSAYVEKLIKAEMLKALHTEKM